MLPWFASTPVNELSAPPIEFDHAMAAFKQACSDFEPHPATSPTKSPLKTAAVYKSKAASPGKVAGRAAAVARPAQGSAAAARAGRSCCSSSLPVVAVVCGAGPRDKTAGVPVAFDAAI